MFLVSSCSWLRSIHGSQVLSWEWRCSWSSADRWCSNYIWVINNFIAYEGATYIRGFTVVVFGMLSCYVLLLMCTQEEWRYKCKYVYNVYGGIIWILKIKMTSFGAPSDDSFIKMTKFLCQCIIMISSCFYPYIYLPISCRGTSLTQGQSQCQWNNAGGYEWSWPLGKILAECAQSIWLQMTQPGIVCWLEIL